MKGKFFFSIILLLSNFTGYSQDIEGTSKSIHISFKEPDPVTTIAPVIQPKPDTLNPPEYHALLIAEENYYQDPNIYALDETINDAQNLYNILTSKYGFKSENITFLKDAPHDSIEIALENLWKLDDRANILIFYAGHGYWDKQTKIGYWVPSDATMQNRAKWFKNSALRDDISAIRSKHVLLISDACFSGSILNTRSINNASIGIFQQMKLLSRRAMTSGNYTEVPAHSTFMEYLLKYLGNNENEFYPSEKLFTDIYIPVINNSTNGSVPVQGVIPETGDEGGDFVFHKID